LIVAGPDTLTQLGLTAAVKNNILVIVGHGCRLTISTRRFRPISFPDLDGVEARLVSLGQAEIVINKAVLIPIWATPRGASDRFASMFGVSQPYSALA
jgi:hypothetical protein